MKLRRSVLAVIVSVTIWVCVAYANPQSDNSPQTIAAVNSWRSAPDLLSRYKEANLRSSYANKISFVELSTAVKPVAAPGRSGLQAAHWLHLPSVPTIHTTDVPQNWCGKEALNFDLYAAKNLGEIVTIGVANNAPSDPPKFHINDYFLASIKVNWSGWKTISVPLNSFTMVRRSNGWKPETPFSCGQDSSIGWNRVSGLYLFSKIFNYQPHPNSEFYIGKVSLGKSIEKVPLIVSFGDYPLQYKSSETEIKGVEGELFNPTSPLSRWWNHQAPEIKTDTPLELPFRLGAYFRHERALLDYFPRYEPGYVNFTAQGVPTIFAGGNAIQYAPHGGKWQVINLADTITRYAKEKLGYRQISMHSGGDDVYAVYGLPILNLDKNDPISLRGLPTYITKYNRQSHKFSTPVLVGYGGTKSSDGHNWAVMAIDSKGILHVIINGHHDPFVYTKSLRPHDITAWTSPQQVGNGTSYLGLVIDRQDTLYSVSRNSENGYYFDLALHRLRSGGAWETKHLVMPSRNYYHVWFHNLNIDPRSGKLFLSYHSQSIELEIFGDDIEMMLYQRPDFAPQTLNSNGSDKYVPRTVIQGSGSGGHETYDVPWDERAILTSSDGGDNWRMALSKDLQAPADCSIIVPKSSANANNADLICH